MKLSELKGKPVITVSEAKQLGTVDDVLVDPSYTNIGAFRIKGTSGSDFVVQANHVTAIGPDAVTVDSRDALRQAEDVTGTQELRSFQSLLNNRVVTEGGKELGRITEVDFDPSIGVVDQIRYGAGAAGWGGVFGGVGGGAGNMFSPADIIGVSQDIVTIREAAGRSRAA